MTNYMQAIDRFITDYCDVLYHVTTHDEYWRGGYDTSELEVSTINRTIHPTALRNMVAWVCHDLTRQAAQTPLTTDDRRVLAAAWRLSDAIHGMRVHYQCRFVRSDGTPDYNDRRN
jgi:hypothetical protein